MVKVTFDEFMDDYLQSAHRGMKAIDEALAYQGSNRDFFLKGRLGSIPLGGVVHEEKHAKGSG